MANVSESLGWKIGEYSHRAVLEEVELGGTNVTFAEGEPVVFSGVNSSGQMIVTKLATNGAMHGVIARKQNGTSGDIRAVVISGEVVAKVGGALSPGTPIHTKDGKLVAHTAGVSTLPYGYARGTTTTDGDYVLITIVQK